MKWVSVSESNPRDDGRLYGDSGSIIDGVVLELLSLEVLMS
jgi:hypothetical protein